MARKNETGQAGDLTGGAGDGGRIFNRQGNNSTTVPVVPTGLGQLIAQATGKVENCERRARRYAALANRHRRVLVHLRRWAGGGHD